jgi:hypothetical protein
LVRCGILLSPPQAQRRITDSFSHLDLAFRLRSFPSMTTTAPVRSTTLLRWAFQKGKRTVTCCIDMVGDGSAFDVCVLPHWDLSSSTIDRFDDAASAFEHHTVIALMLRDEGWMAARNSPRHAIAAA